MATCEEWWQVVRTESWEEEVVQERMIRPLLSYRDRQEMAQIHRRNDDEKQGPMTKHEEICMKDDNEKPYWELRKNRKDRFLFDKKAFENLLEDWLDNTPDL